MTASPTDVTRLLAEAGAAADRSEWEHAADLLANAGSSSHVLDKRGFYLSRAKDYDAALQIYEELARREPTNGLYFYMAGYQHYERGDYDAALPWFDRALELLPQHILTWWRRANTLRHLERQTEAQVAAGTVLRLWHALDDAQARKRYGLAVARASYMLGLYQLKHDPNGAIPLFRQASELDASDHDKHYRLAQAFRRAGRSPEALESVRRARRLKPGMPYIEMEFVESLLAVGDAEQAVATLSRHEHKLRGWLAFKGGRAAMKAEAFPLSIRLLERAAGDRDTRGNEDLAQLLAQVREHCGEDKTPVERPSQSRGVAIGDDRGTGFVDVVRVDRGFGFLVDDADGTRRHFRLEGRSTVARGDRVKFRRIQADKGPAARGVRPA